MHITHATTTFLVGIGCNVPILILQQRVLGKSIFYVTPFR